MIGANLRGRRKHAVAIALAMVLAAGTALPVHAYFQSHGFFMATEKYREWFQSSVWLENTRAAERRRGIAKPGLATSMADKYPYPEEKLVVTNAMYEDASSAVENGSVDWSDIEIVRHRAETEGDAPAMDFLGWMYEKGMGVERDYRKAFMWYERAKLGGQTKSRGTTPIMIFQRLPPRGKYLAKLQLSEDIERAKSRPTSGRKTFETVNLRVLEQQRAGLAIDSDLARIRNYR